MGTEHFAAVHPIRVLARPQPGRDAAISLDVCPRGADLRGGRVQSLFMGQALSSQPLALVPVLQGTIPANCICARSLRRGPYQTTAHRRDRLLGACCVPVAGVARRGCTAFLPLRVLAGLWQLLQSNEQPPALPVIVEALPRSVHPFQTRAEVGEPLGSGRGDRPLLELLQVGDHVLAVLGVLEAGESHLRAGHERKWIFEVLEHHLF